MVVGEPCSTSPRGNPMAITSSPTAKVSESPRSTGSKSPTPLRSRRARSVTSSTPKTSPWYVCPPESLTSTVSNLWTTWALVTTRPSASMMNPEPVPEGVTICTTPGETSFTMDESVGVLVGTGVDVDAGRAVSVGVGTIVAVGSGVATGADVGRTVGTGGVGVDVDTGVCGSVSVAVGVACWVGSGLAVGLAPLVERQAQMGSAWTRASLALNELG